MNPLNRDLLVLTKKITMKPGELEHEMAQLNSMLFHVENLNAFCTANEVMDLNRYQVIQKHQMVYRIIMANRLKPFVFICNKN